MKKIKKTKTAKKKSKNRLTGEEKYKKTIEAVLRDRLVRKNVVTNDFMIFFIVYFQRYIKYKMAKFHEQIFRILENKENKLTIIVAFRGSAKSTIVTTAYVIWSILGNQQKKFVIITAQTEHKARQHLMNIKNELEGNEILRKDLGPFEEERTPWGATALVIKKLNAKIMISSTEQTIRGLRHGEYRPDLIILDDVEDTSSVRNQENRDKLFDWFVSEVIPAGEKNTRIVLVGNLLHDDSLVKRIQKKILLGETDGEYFEYPITDNHGNIAWPGKYPNEEALEEERRKVMNDVTWSREYLLRMVNKEDQIIRREWIQFYDDLPKEDFHSYNATGIDLAISERDTADYTAMVSARIHGYSKTLAVYIFPNVINARLTFMDSVGQAKAISESLGGGKLYVESNGYQGSMVEVLKDARCFKAEGIKVKGDKYSRLNSATILMQAGKVFFPRKGAEGLINQLIGFGVEKHDDMIDAFSLLLNKILEDRGRYHCAAINIYGKYDGQFDHLDPEEKDRMLIVRENLRNMMLL